jgi:Sec-independent protein translocase protein TatA
MENPMKLFILAVIALMILGPSRFAGLGSTLGRTIRDFRNALRSAQDEARQTFSELTDGALEATNEFRQALPSPDMLSDTPPPAPYTVSYETPSPVSVEPTPAAPAAVEAAPVGDEDLGSLATEPTAEAARDLARQARPS